MAGASILAKFNSAIECEAAAFVKGAEMAASLHLPNILVESDCLQVTQSINNHTTHDWRISIFLRNFHKLKPKFNTIDWNWVNREANRWADAAAKLAKVRLSSSE